MGRSFEEERCEFRFTQVRLSASGILREDLRGKKLRGDIWANNIN